MVHAMYEIEMCEKIEVKISFIFFCIKMLQELLTYIILIITFSQTSLNQLR